jgi:hypothetical protein
MERIYTVDGITGKEICTDSAAYCILDYVHDKLVFGWTVTPVKRIRIYEDGWKDENIAGSKLDSHLKYHRGWGIDFLDIKVPLRELVAAQYIREPGYPYSFSKRYEAIENFKILRINKLF